MHINFKLYKLNLVKLVKNPGKVSSDRDCKYISVCVCVNVVLLYHKKWDVKTTIANCGWFHMYEMICEVCPSFSHRFVDGKDVHSTSEMNAGKTAISWEQWWCLWCAWFICMIVWMICKFRIRIRHQLFLVLGFIVWFAGWAIYLCIDAGKTTFVKRHLTGEFEKNMNVSMNFLGFINIPLSFHFVTTWLWVNRCSNHWCRNPLDFFTNLGKIRFNCWDTAGQDEYGGLRDGY